jgi:hypothetical protein
MKKQLALLALTALFTAVLFTACQKSTKDNSTDSNTEITKHSDDQNRFSTEVDAVANDADLAVESSSSFTGREQQTQSVICNATVVYDSVSNPRTITITYNGNDCFNTVNRTGVVRLSMAQGVHWRDAGAVLTVTYQTLHITRLSDNKSITINGVMTHTNVSGGLLINLASLGTITRTITSSGMSVTFDDNSQRTWQVAKQRVYSYNNGVVLTTTGTHADGALTGIAEWGVNRFGHSFVSAITAPLVVRQDCDFRLVSGQVTHVTNNITAVATFGLDAAGNATTCPGSGHYYAKVIWTGPNGNSFTIIFPY